MAGKINLAKAMGILIVLSFVLTSCLPAVTVPPTPTPSPSKTPIPSVTATRTPSPTATPTATATPSPSQIAETLGLPLGDARNPVTYRIEGDKLIFEKSGVTAAVKENGEWKLMWTKLLEGRSEYQRPATPLVMGGVSPAANWEIDPRMSASAVYEDIVAAMIKHVLLPENDYIWKQMVAEHPEWAEIIKVASESTTVDYRRERMAMMKRFMELSKGQIHLRMFHNGKTELVDFNQPVVFECEQVDKVPSMENLIRDPHGPETGAYGIYTSPIDGLVIHWELTDRVWKNNIDPMFSRSVYCSNMLVMMVESLAKGNRINIQRISEPFTKIGLYLMDARKPEDFFQRWVKAGIIRAK